MSRLILSGGSAVLPDAVLEPASVVVENDAIAAIEHRAYPTARSTHEQPEISTSIMAAISEAARTRGMTLTSHDDDTVEKVERMHAAGVRIAEFPVTFEAARRHRALGMTVTAGAPNVVRGGSSSGNLAAEALIAEDLVDLLCADYHAPSVEMTLRAGVPCFQTCPVPAWRSPHGDVTSLADGVVAISA